ncbi:MAG: hypothetical protein Q4B48_07880, partial [Syntrophomonadaceae bacterium]|nr:hypothetical protein [Syntrophomonadaceae bacterium]
NYDLWDQDVTAIMGATGKLVGLVFDEASVGAKNYGLITSVSGTTTASGSGDLVKLIKLLKADDEEYSYAVDDDTYIKGFRNIAGVNADGDLDALLPDWDKQSGNNLEALLLDTGATAARLYNVTLTSDNKVDRIELVTNNLGAYDDLDTDDKEVKFGGSWYTAADVVVFNLNTAGTGGEKVQGWTEFKNEVTANSFSNVDWAKTKSGELQYIVMDCLATSDYQYGIYASRSVKKDNWVTFVGQEAIIYESGASAIGSAKKGDIIQYTTSGGDADGAINILPYKAIQNATGSSAGVGYELYKVSKINNKILTLTGLAGGSASMKVNDDTVYLDVRDDDELEVITGVAVGDIVFAWSEWDAEECDPKVTTAAGAKDIAVVIAKVEID